jgi:hypothetical protein
MFVSGVYVGGDIKGGGKGIVRNSKAVRLRCNESRTSGVVDYMKIVYSVTARERQRLAFHTRRK